MRNTSKLAIAIDYFEKQAVLKSTLAGTVLGGVAGLTNGLDRGDIDGAIAGAMAEAQSGGAIGLGYGLGSSAGRAILPKLDESTLLSDRRVPRWLKAVLMGGAVAMPIAGALGGYALNPYRRPPQTPPKQ